MAPLTPGGRESLYWYSLFTSHENCWQAGEPKESAYLCDNVGASYLPSGAHMRDISVTGVGQDIEISNSGDYCNYYRFGEGLDTTDANSESGYTGYEPPSPLASYQEANHYRSVCQAYETWWGHEVRGSNSNECTGVSYTPCGMQHYVSLAEQGLKDHPWSSSFGEPTLVVSLNNNPFTQQVRGGAWGYVCPLLEDATTGNILEFCISEWTTEAGFPKGFPHISSYDVASACAGAAGHYIDQTITQFAPGTTFATEYSESANTFTFTGSNNGQRRFIAGITQSNLQNAINAVNTLCSADNPKYSVDPKNYALIGTEHGMEGGGLSEFGSSEGNLQLWTEYTPLPPTAATTPATSLQETRATLNGNVNSNATDTHYYFQYGKTTSYGSSTAEVDSGSGTEMKSVNATIAGLQPGTTYHYRIVASSSAGTSPGSDSTFTTLYEEASSRWAVREPETNHQYVFYRKGSNGMLWETLEPGTGWGANERGLQMAPGTTPAVVRDASTGHMYVFYQGNNGALWETYEPGTGWSAKELGGQMSPGTSPSVVRDPSTGHLYVFYQGGNGALWETYEPGTGWAGKELGGQIAANTSPAAIRDPLTGHIWVYYQGSNGALWEIFEPGTGWGAKELGGQIAPGSSPSAVRDPSTGHPFVFYQGGNGALWETFEPGTGWSATELGPLMAPDTSPSAVGDPTTGQLSVYYEGSNHALWQALEPGSGWGAYERGGQMAPGTSPAAVRDPVTGDQWVYYEGANTQLWETYEPGTGWGGKELGLEMSPSLPSADTTAASGIQETQAGLNGTVNPQGAETKYYFEYGQTKLYGTRTASVSAGSGTSNKAAGQTITGLTLEVTYHFRLVATSSAGTTYGEDHTFTTQSAAASGTSPSAVRDPNTGNQYVFFQGRNGQLYEWAQIGSAWTQTRLGGQMATGTSPSAVVTSTGHLYVFYQGSNNQLWETYEPGTGWAGKELGGKIAVNTSPSAVVTSTGHLYVFYQGSNNQLWETYEPGTGWAGKELGGKMAANTSPSAVTNAGHLYVFYQGSNNQLWETYEPGTGWGGKELGGKMAASTSPSAVVTSTSHLWVFYQGSEGQIWQTYEPGTGWGGGEL
jgi:hypothetical protein